MRRKKMMKVYDRYFERERMRVRKQQQKRVVSVEKSALTAFFLGVLPLLWFLFLACFVEERGYNLEEAVTNLYFFFTFYLSVKHI